MGQRLGKTQSPIKVADALNAADAIIKSQQAEIERLKAEGEERQQSSQHFLTPANTTQSTGQYLCTSYIVPTCSVVTAAAGTPFLIPIRFIPAAQGTLLILDAISLSCDLATLTCSAFVPVDAAIVAGSATGVVGHSANLLGALINAGIGASTANARMIVANINRADPNAVWGIANPYLQTLKDDAVAKLQITLPKLGHIRDSIKALGSYASGTSAALTIYSTLKDALSAGVNSGPYAIACLKKLSYDLVYWNIHNSTSLNDPFYKEDVRLCNLLGSSTSSSVNTPADVAEPQATNIEPMGTDALDHTE